MKPQPSNDLVAMLLAAHRDPFATPHDPRALLLMAARAIANQKQTIRHLILELERRAK
jgi:hypothetical protein